MAKNSILNIGKRMLNELKDKFIEQSKETLHNTKNDLIEKAKETVFTKVNDKVNELSKGKANLKEFHKTNTNTPETNSSSGSINEQKVENLSNVQQQEVEKNPPTVSTVEIITAKEEDDAKYNDGDKFENSLNQSLLTLASGTAKNPMEAARVLKELVNMAGEVSKFTEVQKTKRKEIEADRDKYLSKINSQKEILLFYFEKTFDERRGNFEILFQVVDHALATNNTQALSMGLDGINQLALSSPFKDLSNIESAQQALEDKNHIWDI